MSNPIGNKTPANTYNDLLYMNNSNDGVDSTLRSVYSGNGTETKIQLSSTGVAIDFNKQNCTKPLLNCYFIKTNDTGTQSGAYQISTNAGNVQKITLGGNVTLSILSNLETNYGYEMTLIVQQTTGGHKITFSGTFKTPNGQNPFNLSSAAGAMDVIKLISWDGGNTWIAYLAATNIS